MGNRTLVDGHCVCPEEYYDDGESENCLKIMN